jgi:predicted RNase H-like nuclease (RuvC/YqgF family)
LWCPVHKNNHAVDEKRQLENNIKGLKTEFAEEEKAKLAITKDMTRQYKSMQENLMHQVNQAHDSISKLREELDLSKNNMDSKQRAHQKMIQDRDAKIREQKRKMEDMATEFSEMLRQTLEKMKQRIEISNINWENEKGPQMISQLERETANR